jgi:hypothetical protein
MGGDKQEEEKGESNILLYILLVQVTLDMNAFIYPRFYSGVKKEHQYPIRGQIL